MNELNCMNCRIGDFKNSLCDCDSSFYAKYKGIGTEKDFIDALTTKWIPVKHGRWIDMGDNSAPICSVCKSRALLNYESDYHKSDYCPHCGAKMDEREGEEDDI